MENETFFFSYLSFRYIVPHSSKKVVKAKSTYYNMVFLEELSKSDSVRRLNENVCLFDCKRHLVLTNQISLEWHISMPLSFWSGAHFLVPSKSMLFFNEVTYQMNRQIENTLL